MMRRQLRILAVIAAIGVALCGCGQKGDLYLPDHKTSPTFIPLFVR